MRARSRPLGLALLRSYPELLGLLTRAHLSADRR
jgi:hypothetical protein